MTLLIRPPKLVSFAEQSVGARNQVGIGLSYRPGRAGIF